MPFLAQHGFTKVQQEPDNIRGPYKPSPYIPVSSSKNIYMIPLEKLADDEYQLLKKDNKYLKYINEKSNNI